MSTALRTRLARGLQIVAAIGCAAALAGCSDSEPWLGPEGSRGGESAVAEEEPTATPTPAAPSDAVEGPALPGGAVGDIPEPETLDPDTGELTEAPDASTPPIPSTSADRVRADEDAQFVLRTMMSIIESCNSGRNDYRRCDTHEELGDPDALGVAIGLGTGQVLVTASPRQVRLTTLSASGAKWTVARGPRGDRFSCITGPESDACAADRSWSW